METDEKAVVFFHGFNKLLSHCNTNDTQEDNYGYGDG